jgi:hypothetical protein
MYANEQLEQQLTIKLLCECGCSLMGALGTQTILAIRTEENLQAAKTIKFVA